ncbi:DNA adenine methylase [Candidatus Berkelbacteria bacterium CG_4_10_14_0_8_um_filter_35_9_33_8]|uniref:Site-specific DNA-methyltransferase (adenine-specific) n=1 Tax=Candidatus Berkelbacteria bacterium CG_4_10_14_0_2_um_filter_35_9_33_12 TaxID=1974499 RepID=A0A2M7W4K8_9BACT|nr:MAG: DNA adenine methylase [Candidatus Berkelbacteria bacterium CG23_combo_of_CG06-09_8_20_14_all_33_15]PIZ28284.1 MAG: DNA adenine methylase [Candidatus Berkelbacteria bacterium CG_4_10_14_0_8_um_filter_35_9_33_8]PJA20692.1 MAG: DNA adenine methylase [Candidatus Berkelbacteria bacterium CG_4_10_14_0_2_um_filter_35_9_33_12]
MNDAYFGNKYICIAQRRYLGSKTKLLSFIDSIIEKENIEFDSFADIFAGTGTVANHFYNRSKIIVNDILDSNSHIYSAFFGKDEIREEKLRERLKHYNDIEVKKYDENYFSQNFSNTYFDAENAKKIGIIRDDIEKLFEKKIITNREKSYLLTALIYALDRIANTVGHYDAYRKIDIPNKKLFLLPLDITNSQFTAEIYKDDANELVKKIKTDVVYIDPPYNSRQYSDAYHLLENITTWKKEMVYGVAKKIDRSHIKSKYNMKSAGVAFGDLIDNIDAKYILVSYNDMGTSGNVRSQSRISDHEILSALKRRGDVQIYETDFKQFTTGKSSKDDLKERIFLCKVDVSTKTNKSVIASKNNPVQSGFVKSPLNYTGGKHKLLPQITKLFPSDIKTFYDVFSGGANVGINATAKNIICIEKNRYVVSLLKLIQNDNFEDLNQNVVDIIDKFGLSQSYIKGYNHYGVDSSSGLGQYNKDAFLKLRNEYNKEKTRIDLLLVLVLYSFNNQIRFNSKGDFNLPVGKRDYNGSSRKNVAAFNQVSNEKKIAFKNCDFRSIEQVSLVKDDFVYLDPPYLLGLASYNEMGGWTEKDEKDLYSLLTRLDRKDIRFAFSNVLEHKGEINEIMKKWTEKHKYKVHELDYHYKNSNYHSTAKNNKTTEVLITNY